jgi:hypothetical protein
LIDLRASFGQRYKIEHDASYDHERADFRATEEVALQTIVGKWGHVFAYNDELLAASTNSRGRAANNLLRLGLTPLQDASDGLTVLFRPADFRKVAKILLLRTKRTLSPARRRALIAAGRAHRFEIRRRDEAAPTKPIVALPSNSLVELPSTNERAKK